MAGNNLYTKLLIHADGVDGSTDFIDYSAGGKNTLTAQGDAQIDTAKNKFGTGSMIFDGSDTITIPYNSNLNMSSKLGGIDLWLNLSSYSGSAIRTLFQSWNTGSQIYGFIILNGTLYFEWNELGGGANSVQSAVLSWSTNTWYHLAAMLDGTNIHLYKDGIRVATNTLTDFTTSESYFTIGGSLDEGYKDLQGSIDELRITNGICPILNPSDPLYILSEDPADGFDVPTSAYFPSSENLINMFSYAIGNEQQARTALNFNNVITSVTFGKIYEGQYTQDSNARIYGDVEKENIPYENTIGLWHFDGADGDTSGIGFSDSSVDGDKYNLTAVGNAQIDTAQSRFGGSSLALLSGGVNYALTTIAAANFGTTLPFSFGGFFRPTANTTDIFMNITSESAGRQVVQVQTGGKIGYNLYGRSSLTGSTTVSLSNWHHLLVCGTTTNFYIYLDGVLEISALRSNGDVGSQIWTTFLLGSFNSISADIHFDEVFMSNTDVINKEGDPLYIPSGNPADGFTPPIAPYSRPRYKLKFFADGSIAPAINGNVSGAEVLLMHMDDDVADSTGRHTPSAVGTPTYLTSKSGFSKAISLNGSTQYVQIADSADWNLGSSDFTIDCKMYVDTLQTSHLVAQWSDGGDSNKSWTVNLRDGNKIQFSYSTGGTSGVSLNSDVQSLSTGTWYHVAVVRDGTTIRFFLDGIAIGTGNISTDTIADSTRNLNIGTYEDGGGSAGEWFDGLIDEVRIVKGEAIWVTNFTPPTVPYRAGTPAEYGENLYQIAEYNSISSSGENVSIIGSGVGVGMSGVFSYNLGI